MNPRARLAWSRELVQRAVDERLSAEEISEARRINCLARIDYLTAEQRPDDAAQQRRYLVETWPGSTCVVHLLDADMDSPIVVPIGIGSPWATPHHPREVPVRPTDPDRAERIRRGGLAIAHGRFETDLRESPESRWSWMRDHVHLLAGHSLACTCLRRDQVLTIEDPLVCHGQVLARAAEEACRRA